MLRINEDGEEVEDMEVGMTDSKNSLAAKKTEEIARMRAAMTPEQRNEEFIKMLAERGVSVSMATWCL